MDSCRKAESRRRAIVLASSSARRIALFRRAGIAFQAIAPTASESIGEALPPSEAVIAIARAKADSVSPCVGAALILGFDTILVVDGEIFGKPKDCASARRMLRRLSSSRAQALTGVVLIAPTLSYEDKFARSAAIEFGPIPDNEMDEYIAREDPMSAAGGFKIQTRARSWVRRCEGSLDTIIGAPIEDVTAAIARFNERFPKWLE